MRATFVAYLSRASTPRRLSQEVTDISSRLQKVQEGCSRGERSEREQAQALGTAGDRNAGDQAGLRSDTGTAGAGTADTGAEGTGAEAAGTEDPGSRERQEEDNGAPAEQPVVAESHADHGRLRDQ